MALGAAERAISPSERRLDCGALALYLLGTGIPGLGLACLALFPDAAARGTLFALAATALASCLVGFVAMRRLTRRWLARMDARTRELARALAEKDALAYQDILTGLPNRRLYLDRVEQALLWARRHEGVVAICFLDLDGFKRVNDALGHDSGDRVLCEVAKRLLASLRLSDAVARMPSEVPDTGVSRLGGDEFTFVLRGIEEPHHAANVAWRVLESLRRPFILDGHEVFASASIGIALYPYDGEDAETLLRNADVAMYHAKECGRNNYQFYDRFMNESYERRLHVERSLRRALEEGEFRLLYQPIRDAATGQIRAAEALLRWDSPEGPVSPAEFIPIAEETSLIVDLGEWVLRTACAQCEAWRTAGLRAIRMGVNVSGRQIRQPSFVSKVARVLRDTGLSAAHLELEITESTIMQQDDVTNATFRALDEMGVGLALDDFGTGYSSLSYLRRFAIDSVKVDRAFIGELPVNPDDAALTEGIIAMAHSLRLRVVAEGVETVEQAEFLRAKGCDELQGYLFSRPVPAEDFIRLLEREKDEEVDPDDPAGSISREARPR